MINPNIPCKIQISSGRNDVYGRPIPGELVKELCCVVKLLTRNEKSSVRADSSASRGSAHEFETDAVLLLAKNTRASVDDILEVAGQHLRISGIFPRFAVNGVLDHYQIEAKIWSK